MYSFLRLALLMACGCCIVPLRGGEAPADALRRAGHLREEGNTRDAAELYMEVVLHPAASDEEAALALKEGVQAFLGADLPDVAASLVDAALRVRPESWRIHFNAAWLKTMLGGIHRPDGARPGLWRPGNREQSRREALTLMLRAEALFRDAEDGPSAEERLRFYDRFASILSMGRETGYFWRLTALTDLSGTTAPEQGVPPPHTGAPVGDDGKPIYYAMPESWSAAANDGERWRWALGRMAASGGEGGRELADRRLADFLLAQFGVQSAGGDGEVGAKTGPFAVRTLGEDETIARLVTGVSRFTMPEEFNHIAIYRRLAGSKDPAMRMHAWSSLAAIFENRQQYHKAVSFREALAAAGDRKSAAMLETITGRTGSLEAGETAPAGQPTTLSYLFRNGRRVRLTAKRLDEKAFLGALYDTYRQFPSTALRNPAMQDPMRLGLEVAERGDSHYVEEVVATWEVDLDPLPDYLSSRVDIPLPFTGGGCYLVEAAMEGGNTSRVVLWIADLALVRHDGPEIHTLYVADAFTGKPVADATITLLGLETRYNHHRDAQEHLALLSAEKTDASGMARVDAAKMRGKTWFIAAQAGDGRLAYMGFQPVWAPGRAEDHRLDEPVAFLVTDRPAYRPGQDIHFKIWSAAASHADGPGNRRLDGRPLPVAVINPRGETVYEKTLTTDEYGGAEDSLVLDDTAPLGHYTIAAGGHRYSVSFRLEEYRKPEFEVTVDTPAGAATLGDTVTATVRAGYYHGAPVTDATVTYRVLRTTFAPSWSPPWEWEWLYGPQPPFIRPLHGGGASSRRPAIARFSYEPPEVVAEGVGELDAEGVFRLAIDTAPAKQHMGDRDHSYAIAVEVTDRSRRTITGAGTVVATRSPFTVKVWTDAGYARVGDDLRVRFRALLPGGAGIAASGEAVLSRLRYTPDGEASEEESARWTIAAGADGYGHIRVAADRAGQYLLRVTLRNGTGAAETGEILLTFRGAGGEGDFRYEALELVPDRQEYRPGDTVRLAVNSSRPDAVVLLYLRAERNGEPQPLLELTQGSAVVDIPVGREDQPNFYVEAITVFDGRVHHETREIYVPPADRTLTVELSPDKAAYPPDGRAAFTVQVRDADGNPVRGQCAVTLYDKSVEAIAGGGNAGDIRARFWGWKRHYGGSAASSLDKRPYRAARKGDGEWRPVGVFGYREADWNEGYGDFRRTIRASGEGLLALEAVPAPPMAAPSLDEAPAAPAISMYSAGFDAMDGESSPMRSMRKSPVAGGAAVHALADSGDAGGMVEAALRSEFADTALWIGALETDADGRASFDLEMPQNLTTWQARAWVMAPGARVGDGEAAVVTTKSVIVRPQAPRFLTGTDRVILSANLHNYLPRAKVARAELVLEGGLLEPAEGTALIRRVELAAGGEERVDWLVDARRPGEARIVMKLLTDEESDAAEIRLPVIVHGARRVESFGGVLRDGEHETVIRLRVPEARLADQSRLELRFSPTVAASMLEALPYLIEYPYGCTEQTLNRFLPLVAVRAFLEGMDADLADARRAGEAAGDDAAAAGWRKKWGDPRSRKGASAVFDDAELAAMTAAGVERLSAMQNADGGWGWFSGPGERSYPHTTAVVVHGLEAARARGAAIPMNVLEKGVDWLRAHQNEQIDLLKAALAEPVEGEERTPSKRAADNTDAFIHLILASRERFNPDMRDFLYRDRAGLSLTGLSMLGLALHREGATNALATVRRNLDQYLETDPGRGTAWLRTPAAGWWWWYNSAVETQIWYLAFLTAVEPQGPTASGVAKYLLENRKNGAYWQSTRDTAYAVQALADYAVASGEANPDMRVTVLLDGRPVMERRLTAAGMLEENRFSLEGVAVEAGDHELRIVRSGSGNVYYSGSLDLFSLEDPIPAAGGELTVARAYRKLVREDAAVDTRTASGTVRAGAVEHYRREDLPSPFADGRAEPPTLQAGDLVEVELTVTAANDYEYLVFEDMKAAGLEAVEVTSGYGGNGMGAYVEYRDQKVVLFVRYLPRGTHTIRYRFRAEIPGSFSALPVFGGGMYATDLFANSEEMKLRIAEEGVYDGR